MIRIMTEEDVEEVAALEKVIFTDPWSENVYRQTLSYDGVIYVVVEIDGKICGAAGVRDIVSDGEITNVMIAPEYRCRGLGFEMLTELLKRGTCAGIKNFTLEVRKSNAGAIRLYEKLGFVSEGIRPGFYDHPKEDAVIMWKRQV